jgi:phage-related protein
VIYDRDTFEKFNLEIGEQVFSGDSSVPRVVLRIFQDRTRIIEDLVNNSFGALGGQVKLIRVNEKFLDVAIGALEADYDILTAESDTEWVTFTLGMPNPLLQRIPLRLFSSSICPYHIPSLFRGVECQYTGGDGTCTGKLSDCRTKGNAVHWGADVGLDASVAKA